MKVAIPTNDWETVSTYLGCCKGFAIFDLEGSRIKCQEYRCSDISSPGKEVRSAGKYTRNLLLYTIIKDCQAIILRETEEPVKRALTKRNIKVYLTEEACVENALDQYIRNHLVCSNQE